jgi:hypothetical protein
VIRVYVNGAVIASATVASTIFPSVQACVVGNDNNNSRYFPGRLDEVRVVKGTAMYGGAFTPPTGPFGFTTWSTTDKSASMTLSGGNLIATASAGAVGVRGKDPKRTGKYYVEYTSTTTQNPGSMVGFATAATPLASGLTSSAIEFASSTTRSFDSFGNIIASGSAGGFTTGSVVGAAIDLDAGLIWFRLSPAGNWNGSATNNPATSVGGLSITGTGLGQGIDAYPFTLLIVAAASVTANFGASAFTGAVPAGFTSGWDDSVAIVTNEIVTQVGVEEWGSSVPAMQATQVGIEEWGRSANPTAVTQVSAEHWATTSPDAAITQALVEHWGTVSTISTQAVVTQVLVEHWIPAAVVSTARPRRLVCISG